ncbi:hypothetical protein RW25_28425 [Bacillus sp. L_1B0_8]|uniref:phosphoglycerate kinase n=1 Tax=unclassified Bacillus (in: firmicutes) TaxID=185979 RepID=UPI0005B749C7|nr:MULTISPECIES: phosphoglycerate kinase [unclassified Bacillus (in: firmicutes)]KIQ77607.1 hypothetical protein RT27_30895 [Bacillus sp. L_1B0_5]KIQ78078.1 hypothetical protein RW25_28425 [Bacillus sp. L_1B0_8]
MTKNRYSGKKVIVRVDHNVPIDDKKRITSDFRIRSSVPALKSLINQGAKTIIISHLGTPKKGETSPLSMRDISRRLEEYINKEIKFLSYNINDWRLKEEIEMMNDGDVVYLENIRRFKDELENTNSFSRELAQLGDIYINDAFSAFHRKHSSTYGLATLLESEIGHTAKAEIETLNRIKLKSDKPLVTIIGGEKIVEKLNAMEGLLNESDVILTGGIIATIFLQVLNYPISHSFSSTLLEQAKRILNESYTSNKKVIIPEDVYVLRGSNGYYINIDSIIPGDIIMDIGPKTILTYEKIITSAKTIFWSGPLGKIEDTIASKGSVHIAQKIASCKAFSVIGGGHTVGLLDQLNLIQNCSFVSTGGSACLKYLSNNNLPVLNLFTEKTF